MLFAGDFPYRQRQPQAESERIEVDMPCLWCLKTSRSNLFLFKKADFKPKLIRRVKEGYVIQVNGTIPQDDKMFINIYAPNIGVPNYMKHTI